MPDTLEPAPTAVGPLPVLPDVSPETVTPLTAAEMQARTPWQIAWLRFKRHKLAMAGAIILLILLVVALLAPLIARQSYSTPNILTTLKSPSKAHPFGTDNIGRDEFARVIYGGRISLLVGVSVALSSTVIGTLVGALAGFYGRWLDQVLMRVTDLFLSIPFLVVLILATNFLSGSVFDIVLILSLFFWMPNARIVRGVFLSLKEKEFVESARAAGSSSWRIIFSEMLPNAIGPVIVILTLGVAQAIITESALSFLGFGVKNAPSWGNLLSDARSFVLIHPPMVWFPGAFILITVLSVNLMGDGLRDALDPHQQLGNRE